jgi:divalent metal cation (Fe/Co/Zn/Cd) transporter
VRKKRKKRKKFKRNRTIRMPGMDFVRSARFHAVLSAYLSIAAGVTIAILALVAADEESSMSLYGAAFMGLIDSTGSVLVLMVYHTCTVNHHTATDRLEAQYSIIIGGLMLVMGVYLLTDSSYMLALQGESLAKRESNANNNLGFTITIIGGASSLSLSVYKFVVADWLGSAVIFTGKR